MDRYFDSSIVDLMRGDVNLYKIKKSGDLVVDALSVKQKMEDEYYDAMDEYNKSLDKGNPINYIGWKSEGI